MKVVVINDGASFCRNKKKWSWENRIRNQSSITFDQMYQQHPHLQTLSLGVWSVSFLFFFSHDKHWHEGKQLHASHQPFSNKSNYLQLISQTCISLTYTRNRHLLVLVLQECIEWNERQVYHWWLRLDYFCVFSLLHRINMINPLPVN